MLDMLQTIYLNNQMIRMSSEEFAAAVVNNRAAVSAPIEAYTLAVGTSSLAVRRRGSFLTQCVLTQPGTGVAVPVMYCEEDTAKSKLTASHPMMPVGPSDGVGGQHGFPRWVDYNPTDRARGAGVESLSVYAELPRDMTPFTRTFRLRPSRLSVSTSVTALGEPISTSIGHHDYYSLEDGDYDGLTLNGRSIDELLGAGATEAVMNGEARFWSGFGETGKVDVRFPNDTALKISAFALSLKGSQIDSLGMLIWRRSDAPYICLEPTLGVVDTPSGLETDQANIIPHDTVSLTVSTQLL